MLNCQCCSIANVVGKALHHKIECPLLTTLENIVQLTHSVKWVVVDMVSLTAGALALDLVLNALQPVFSLTTSMHIQCKSHTLEKNTDAYLAQSVLAHPCFGVDLHQADYLLVQVQCPGAREGFPARPARM